MSDFSSYATPTVEWMSVAATVPPPSSPPSTDISALQAATNASREAAAAAQIQILRSQLSITDHTVNTRDNFALALRIYRANTTNTTSATTTGPPPIYIHHHGGGFLFGTLASEDAICARLALATSAIIVNVNYRHTPEHTYPTAWNDAEDAFEWVVQHADSLLSGDPHNIIIGGISAGAWLGASLARSLCQSNDALISHRPQHHRYTVRGMVLAIPCLVHQSCYSPIRSQIEDDASSSYVQCQDAPILPMSRRKLFGDLLRVQDPHADDPRLNPGLLDQHEARRMPPTTLLVAGNDTLRDEGLLYGKMLADAG